MQIETYSGLNLTGLRKDLVSWPFRLDSLTYCGMWWRLRKLSTQFYNTLYWRGNSTISSLCPRKNITKNQIWFHHKNITLSWFIISSTTPRWPTYHLRLPLIEASSHVKKLYQFRQIHIYIFYNLLNIGENLQ